MKGFCLGPKKVVEGVDPEQAFGLLWPSSGEHRFCLENKNQKQHGGVESVTERWDW